jgi:hypothetical protein
MKYQKLYNEVTNSGSFEFETIASKVKIINRSMMHPYILVINGQPVPYKAFQTLSRELKKRIHRERVTKVYSSGNEFNLLLKDKDVSYFYSDEEKHILVYDNSFELLSHGREAENSLVDKVKKKQFELITSLTTVQAIKNKREYEKET